MKKAKVMLLTIAVIASVGTALAFKTHKFGTFTYCYLTTTDQPLKGECTDRAEGVRAANSNAGIFYAVEPSGGCSEAICDHTTSVLAQ